MDHIHIFNLYIDTSVFLSFLVYFFNFYYPINIFYSA